MGASEAYEDHALVARLTGEQKVLTAVVEAYRAYLKCGSQMQTRAHDRPEFKDLAQEEYKFRKRNRSGWRKN